MLIIQLQPREADIVGVTPAGQELKLENDWVCDLRKGDLTFWRSKQSKDKDNTDMGEAHANERKMVSLFPSWRQKLIKIQVHRIFIHLNSVNVV